MSAGPVRSAPAAPSSLIVGGTALAMAVGAFAVAARPSAAALGLLAVAAALPYAAVVAPNLRRILLGAILVDVLLQWDLNIGFRSDLAELGAEGGLSLSLTTFALAGLYVLWALERTRPRSAAPRPVVKPARPLIAYVAVCALSVAVARDVALSVYYVALLVQTLLLFVYVVSWVRERADLLFVVTTLMAALLAESALIVFLAVTEANFTVAGITTESALPGADSDAYNRLGGTISSANTAGSVLALLMAVALGVLVSPVPRRLRQLALAALAVAVPALVLTGSRGGWVAFAVAAVIVTVLAVRRGAIRPRRAVGTAVAIAVLALPVGSIVVDRVANPSPGSDSSRVSMARFAVEIIGDRPLLGVGVNNVAAVIPEYAGPEFTRQFIYTIHNKYLLVASEAGLAALLAFAWFLLATLASGVRSLRAADPVVAGLAGGLVAGLVGHMVHMTVDMFGSRASVQILWLVAALLTAMAAMASASRGRPAGSATV